MGIMKLIPLALIAALAGLTPAQDPKATGRISGRISPAGVSVKIVAKLKGTDASQKANVKGEVELPKAGEFAIDKVSPGNYDLLFTLQGEEGKKFIATRWSEVEVEAGRTTAGCNYR